VENNPASFLAWKVTNGSISQIINTDYNWQDSVSTSGVCGFEITRTDAGLWSLSVDTDGGFDNLESMGTITDSTHVVGSYFVVAYEYTSSADRNLWIDDIFVTSTGLNPNDVDSEVESPTTQIPTGTISSLATDIDSAVSVFKFKVSDAGSGDGLSTDISRIVIKNPIPSMGADWTTHIKGVVFNDGSSDINIETPIITANDITFPIMTNRIY